MEYALFPCTVRIDVLVPDTAAHTVQRTGYSTSCTPSIAGVHMGFVFVCDTSTVLGTLCILYSEKSVHSMSLAGFTFDLLLVGMRTICTTDTNF